MSLVTFLSILTGVLGILMSLGHFAQAHRIFVNKSSKDVSLITYLIFTVGAYVWLAYGIMISDWPIMLSFGIAVVGTTLVMVLIFKYRRI